MIAVWLVGPPSVVASATTSFGIQARGVGGREVFRAQDRRDIGHGNAGLGQPAQFGDHAVADVPQIGDPFGHQAAELGEHVDELVDRAPPPRGTAGMPPLMRFSAAPSQARSCASVAVAASTSEAAPVACAARSRSRSATALAAAVNRAASAGRSVSSISAADASSTTGSLPGRITGAY